MKNDDLCRVDTHKLGGWLSIYDKILDEVTFQQLIDSVYHGSKIKDEKAVRQAAREILNSRIQDFWYLIEHNMQEIIDAATPEHEKPLLRHPDWSEERVEALAKEICEWLTKHEMWIDICIYYNGKRMSTDKVIDGKHMFRYNGEPYIEENVDPRNYFDYVAKEHILSMSFEGPLYDVLNAYTPGWTKLEAEFQAIFERHGCYYELGECWNLSCYV